MIPDAKYAFSTNKLLPAIEKKDGRTVVTYSLTVDEVLYVTWQNNVLKHSLAEKATHLFLGASPQMQQSFNAAIREYTTPPLLSLVSAIAAKTATYVMNSLKVQGKTTEINDETEQKQIAAALQQDMLKKGNIGAMITAREAQVITTFVQQYQASMSKK